MSSINCEYKILSHEEYILEKRSKPYHERFRVKKVYKPAKDKENNKIERIQIRVSIEQKKHITEMAKQKNMNISEFILDVIEGIKK